MATIVAPKVTAANYYRGTLTMADIMTDATKVLNAGEWTKIGEKVVTADQLLGMGYGANQAQTMAEGRIYVDLKDNTGTPVAVNGQFRIMMQSSQDMPLGTRPVILDVDCAILRSGSTDRTAQIPFPFNDTLLSKDKKFTFWVKNKAASAVTLVKANSTALIDITQQLV